MTIIITIYNIVLLCSYVQSEVVFIYHDIHVRYNVQYVY